MGAAGLSLFCSCRQVDRTTLTNHNSTTYMYYMYMTCSYIQCIYTWGVSWIGAEVLGLGWGLWGVGLPEGDWEGE